ncbi:hypothetical protein Tco_1440096 [Tanacetum coccineum]
MSQDVIVVYEMFNVGVEMLSLFIGCSTDESRCYRYTLDVQRMSQDAIVVHEMFNGGVEMLSLYIRCSTDESRYAIVVHEMFNGGVEMLSLYIRCSTDESRCYCYTLDVQRIPRHAINMWLVTRKLLLTQDRMRQWDVVGNQVLNTTNINFASSKWSDIVDWLLPFTNGNNVTSIGDRLTVDATYGKNATTELTGKVKDILSN